MALQPQEIGLEDVAQNLIVNPAEDQPQSDPQPQPDDQPADEDPAQDAEALQEADEPSPEDAGDPLEDTDDVPEHELDADDDDLEDGDEYTEEDYFEVKADGKTHHVTLDELKRSYSGQQAINNRLKDAADAKREAEAAQQQVQELHGTMDKARQDYLTKLNDLDAMMGDADGENIDWDDLYARDPEEWKMQRELYRSRKEYKEAIAAERKKAEEEQKAEQQQRFNAYALHQAELLKERVPEMVDPKTSQSHFATLVQFAGEYGFSPQEMGQTLDARAYHVLNDLYKLKNGVKQEVAKTTRKRRKKTVVRPGSGTQRTVQKSRQQKRVERLQTRAVESGSAEDVAALMVARAKNGG